MEELAGAFDSSGSKSPRVLELDAEKMIGVVDVWAIRKLAEGSNCEAVWAVSRILELSPGIIVPEGVVRAVVEMSKTPESGTL